METSLPVAAPELSDLPCSASSLPRGRSVGVLCSLGFFAACFVLALLPRLVGLDSFLTSDEGFWTQRTLRFGSALAHRDWSSTYRSGHPGVTLMWVGLLGVGPERLVPFLPYWATDPVLVQGAPGYLEVIAAERRALAIATAGLAALTVLLACRLLGPGAGLAGGLLLLLDPYLVGSSQVVHVDALLAPLMTVAALAGLIYWTQARRWSYLSLSGIAAGLALLTKAPAAHVVVFLWLVALLTAARRRGWDRLRPSLVWAGAAALVYWVLWPALWLDPIGVLGDVADFALSVGGNPHELPNFFLGRTMQSDPGPLYYPVALAFRMGPLAVAGLIALPIGLRSRSAPRGPVAWLITYVVLFLAMMTLGAKKFDRYALPALMVLDLLAGVGLWLVLGALKGRLAIIGLGALAAVEITLLALAFPYPLGFYNPLLGGAAGAERAIVVGWGEGLEQAADYLNAQPGADGRVAATLYDDVLRPLFRGRTVGIGDPEKVNHDPDYDYYVIYVNMAQRGLIPRAIARAMATDPPEFTAVVHGVEYAWVYRVPPEAKRAETDAGHG
jgi:hypothetical protein